MARFKKGECGNKNGRGTKQWEEFNFHLLDTVGLPSAIKHCISVLDGTHDEIKNMHGQEKVRLQNDAAKTLLSKAPERSQISGAGGAPIFLPSEILGKNGISAPQGK
jgi:hypothetical protein